MATNLHNLSEYDLTTMPSADWVRSQRFVIIVSDWNSEITFNLCQGAVDTLLKHGALKGNIDILHVPGAVELVYAAARFVNSGLAADAVIAIGCVIQGDTPHFDYVCQAATQGIAELNTKGTIPVVFTVLTTRDMQQAKDRSGGKLGNKGVEGAVTAIKMAHFRYETR